jgi:hypothetical protein
MQNVALKHCHIWIALCSLAVTYASAGRASHGQTKDSPNKSQRTKVIVYTNQRYGFRFYLPDSWRGYSIVLGEWQGGDGKTYQPGEVMPPGEKGPLISIRHPLSTDDNPRQGFEIMVFTKAQWKLVRADKMVLSAAPVGPYELGRNAKYVFALPPRFNYAGIDGWQEASEIIQSHPLHAF